MFPHYDEEIILPLLLTGLIGARSVQILRSSGCPGWGLGDYEGHGALFQLGDERGALRPARVAPSVFFSLLSK